MKQKILFQFPKTTICRDRLWQLLNYEYTFTAFCITLKMERTEKRIQNKPEQRQRIGSFIHIHLVVLTVNAIHRLYSVKHNTIKPYTYVLHVSASLLQKFIVSFWNKRAWWWFWWTESLHCFVALKCPVWLHTCFLFQLQGVLFCVLPSPGTQAYPVNVNVCLWAYIQQIQTHVAICATS